MNTVALARRPAALLGIIEALIGLLVAFGLSLTTEQSGAVLAFAAAAIAVATFLLTKPAGWLQQPALYLGALRAALALALAFVPSAVTPEQVGSIMSVAALVLAYVAHQELTPRTSSVSRSLGDSSGAVSIIKPLP
jgi:hypothetical protein